MKRLGYMIVIGGIFIIAMMFVSTMLLQVIWVDEPDLLLDPDDVRGMVVVNQGVPYTLNFTQQNDLINFLNQMQEISEPNGYSEGKNLPFDELIIYHFDTPDDIVRGKVFEGEWTVLTFDTDNYLRYLSNRPRTDFLEVLKEAYDPDYYTKPRLDSG